MIITSCKHDDFWYFCVWDGKSKLYTSRCIFPHCINHIHHPNFWDLFPMYPIWTGCSSLTLIFLMPVVGVEWECSDPRPLRSWGACQPSSECWMAVGCVAFLWTDRCAPCCPKRSWFEFHSCRCGTAGGHCWEPQWRHLVACWWGDWSRSQAGWLGSQSHQSLTSGSCSDRAGACGKEWGGHWCRTGRGAGQCWTVWGLCDGVGDEDGGPARCLLGWDTQYCFHLPRRSAFHPQWLSTSLLGSHPHHLHLRAECLEMMSGVQKKYCKLIRTTRRRTSLRSKFTTPPNQLIQVKSTEGLVGPKP